MHCEDLWIEFQSRKQSIILSTIYKHLNSDLLAFQDKLEETLIKSENTKSNYIINGDINVNLLKSNSAKVKNYNDMINSVRCHSLISSPITFFPNCAPSLLDNIYTIITKGLCVYDISDHIPTFLMVQNLPVLNYDKPIFRRSMKNFDLETFLNDLQKQLQSIAVSNLTASVSNDSANLTYLKIFLTNMLLCDQCLEKKKKTLK